MRATFELEEDAEPSDLLDFERWLNSDPDVTDSMSVTVASKQSENEHMSAGDVIVVVSTAVSSLAAVVSAYAAWKSARGSAPTLLISIDGRTQPLVVREGTLRELEPPATEDEDGGTAIG